MVYNPSLREEPRKQVAAAIPSKQESSILDWLETTGRLLARDTNELEYSTDGDEEISALMGSDDNSFDVDDDDDEMEIDD